MRDVYWSEEKIKENLIFRNLMIVVILAEVIMFTVFALKIRDRKEYNQQVSLGEKYLQEMDYENAEVCYLAMIEIDEKDVTPYLRLAQIYIETEQFEDAYAILEKAEAFANDDQKEIIEEFRMKVQDAVEMVLVPETEPEDEAEDESAVDYEADYLAYLREHSEYSYYTLLDVNADGIPEMLATDRVDDNYCSSYNAVDLFVWKDGLISLVCDDMWAKYSYLAYDSENQWIVFSTGGTGSSGQVFVYLNEELDAVEEWLEWEFDYDDAGNEIVSTYYNHRDITGTVCEEYDQILNKWQNGSSENIVFQAIPREVFHH